MSQPLTPKYMLLEGLTGVAAWRDGGDMVVRSLAPEDAGNGLPYGYAHNDPTVAVFQVRANTEGDEPLDGRRWKSLALSTELAADQPWRVRIRLRGAGWQPAHTEWWKDLDIQPGECELRIDTSDLVMCMDSGVLDTLRFDVFQAAPGSELRIRSITPEEHDGASFWAPRIDRFGQRIAGRWHGKIESQDDLEADGGAPLPAPLQADERDAWGGWKSGARFEVTGAFGLERDAAGAWWLVTPDGNPYLSLGACCTGVGSVSVETFLRESWFEELPGKRGELAEAWRTNPPHGFAGAELYPRQWHRGDHAQESDLTFCNFTVANLIRTYGEDWYQKWCDRTAARLDAWGMTSLGCWSDLGFAAAHNRPTVIPAERISPPQWGDLLARGDAVWPVKAVPDAFHPRFEQAVDGCFSGLESLRGEPWVLGFFVGNEQKWAFLVSPFAMPLDWTSRQVFVDGLKERYGTVDALNQTWSTAFASWDTLAATQTNSHWPGLSEQGVADCDAFLERFCDRYFGLVRKELNRAVPGALFWGCRYLALQPRAAVVRGSARHMDIVSVNWYLWHKQEPEDAESFLGQWHDLCGGKPLAMTEWSFEVTDDRLLASRILVTTEQERAELAARYMRSCFRLPFVVGLHWFQWPDQPILGRSVRDGERSAFGIVDVADRPHQPLAETFRACSEEMYPLHQPSKQTKV